MNIQSLISHIPTNKLAELAIELITELGKRADYNNTTVPLPITKISLNKLTNCSFSMQCDCIVNDSLMSNIKDFCERFGPCTCSFSVPYDTSGIIIVTYDDERDCSDVFTETNGFIDLSKLSKL